MRFRQQSLIVLSLVCGPLNNSVYCFALAAGQATSGSIDAGKLLSAFAYVPVPRPHISEPLAWYDWHAFAEKAMPSALNTAATPPSVPLPESSVAGKLCCDHRHFMCSGFVGDCRHRASHALNTPLMQYALRRVCLRIRLQMKRRQIYHAEPRHRRLHLRPATQASYAYSKRFPISSKCFLQMQTHIHYLYSLFTAPPVLPTARPRLPSGAATAAARPSHGSGFRKRRKRGAVAGMTR